MALRASGSLAFRLRRILSGPDERSMAAATYATAAKSGKKGQDAKGKEKGGGDVRDRAADILKEALARVPIKTVEVDAARRAEEMAMAKDYSRKMMAEHRARMAGESARLRLKRAAIEALPPGLRAAALVPDLTPFPRRLAPTATPPKSEHAEDAGRDLEKAAALKKSR